MVFLATGHSNPTCVALIRLKAVPSASEAAAQAWEMGVAQQDDVCFGIANLTDKPRPSWSGDAHHSLEALQVVNDQQIRRSREHHASASCKPCALKSLMGGDLLSLRLQRIPPSPLTGTFLCLAVCAKLFNTCLHKLD